MPRYFFHTDIEGDRVIDPEGQDLHDADAAYEEARILALNLMQGAEFDPALLRAIIVVLDAAEKIVLELPLTEILASAPPARETRH